MASIQPRSEPRKEQVCSVCLAQCTHSRFFCDFCASWVHTNCESLTPDKVKSFQRLPPDLPYICKKCRSDEEGVFDYEKASERLHKAAIQGYKKLQACVKRELLFLDGGFVGVSGIGNLAVDQYSQTLLDMHARDQAGIPACTNMEGQALFCAASLAVSARESLATELRVRCCLEMVAHESYYRWQKNHAQLAQCAPEYMDSCLDCAIPGEAASVWMMSALPSVVNRPLTSVYPHIGHPSNLAPKVLNTTFYPRGEGVMSQPVKIMWTNKDMVNANQKWMPNHFVPLFEHQQPDSGPSSPAPEAKHEMDHEIEGHMDDNFDDPDLHAAVAQATREAIAVAEGGFPMDIPRYMDVYEAYDYITNATEVQDGIPKGRKDNCWFLIDNSYNVSNPTKKNCFFDDCGVWDSKLGSVVKSYYVFGSKNELNSIRVKDGLYQMLTACEQGKRQWVNLDPPPDPDKMVICHRYYAFLKRDTNYKRRILWFTFPPGFEKGRDVAIAEYCGLYPGHGVAHGNSKNRKAYRRTDPRLLDQIAEHLKSNDITPNKLYKDLVKSIGPDNTLRDARQIRNLKYKINKKAGKVKPRPRTKGQSVHGTQTPVVESQRPIQVVIQGVQSMDDIGHMVLDESESHKVMQVSGQTAIQLVGLDGATTALQRDVDTQTIIIEGLSAELVDQVSQTFMEQAE